MPPADVDKVGGLEPLVALLGHAAPAVRASAAGVIATVVANNPTAQVFRACMRLPYYMCFLCVA